MKPHLWTFTVVCLIALAILSIAPCNHGEAQTSPAAIRLAKLRAAQSAQQQAAARLARHQAAKTQAAKKAAKVKAASTTWECTTYVAKALGLPNNYPNAKNWGPYLKKNGYSQLAEPRNGAVIVFQPNAGHGVDTTNGHVGIAVAVQAKFDKKQNLTGWAVTVRGAHQGGDLFQDAGCSNVSKIVFNIQKSERTITYWGK